jgi:hypothetical protein
MRAWQPAMSQEYSLTNSAAVVARKTSVVGSVRLNDCLEHMLTKEQAQRIAMAFIADVAQESSRQYVLLEDKIIEKPYAWVFPFDTREYAETGNIRAMVLGTGPIVVNRQTGSALMAPAMPIQQYLAHYEAALSSGTNPPTSKDGKPGPA